MNQWLILSAVALLATFSGILETRADTVRGLTLPFGPGRNGLSDSLLNAILEIAFVLSFFWVWQTWPWYASVLALVAMKLMSRFVVTYHTMGRWIEARPIFAAAAAGSVVFLWLVFPPP